MNSRVVVGKQWMLGALGIGRLKAFIVYCHSQGFKPCVELLTPLKSRPICTGHFDCFLRDFEPKNKMCSYFPFLLLMLLYILYIL